MLTACVFVMRGCVGVGGVWKVAGADLAAPAGLLVLPAAAAAQVAAEANAVAGPIVRSGTPLVLMDEAFKLHSPREFPVALLSEFEEGEEARGYTEAVLTVSPRQIVVRPLVLSAPAARWPRKPRSLASQVCSGVCWWLSDQPAAASVQVRRASSNAVVNTLHKWRAPLLVLPCRAGLRCYLLPARVLAIDDGSDVHRLRFPTASAREIVAGLLDTYRRRKFGLSLSLSWFCALLFCSVSVSSLRAFNFALHCRRCGSGCGWAAALIRRQAQSAGRGAGAALRRGGPFVGREGDVRPGQAVSQPCGGGKALA